MRAIVASKKHARWLSRGPTVCALAAPPPIDGCHIVADAGLENNPDRARREAASAASAGWAESFDKQPS